MKDFFYYAFISYQRKDEKWAKWLQRKLENYKLPVTNAKEASYKESKYIRPVFRDKTDLTAGPLPDALKDALNQSRYLIVICSPNAVQSPWVNDEINTFVNSDRTKYIIPFIVDGEPYSDNKANECFPDALKAIPKEQELLGVNINEGGKERAFIRTVAYMLGVKFDELWNRYERHRKKMRNIAIACMALFAAIALGVYDYTRTKVEYYADWVDCNGIAQGIIPLTDEQVSHRNASFKFEYARVPLGEKKFYSWRLKKVSLVNPRGVISSATPANHAFFYPIQEYKYTDGFVTEIINRDRYNRVVMRYTIKDDYDHKVACLVDMEGKEKHQGDAYLTSSTTAFLSEENSNNTMSKIKRFHYTRNEKGYVTKVTYHANDADELDESAIGDDNNIYGKVFDLDSHGRVTKVSYINHEGKLMTDKYGVGSIRYNNAAFGDNDTIEYLGGDGKLAYNEHRFARQTQKLDKYGNPTEQWYDGVDGKPCYDYENKYHLVATYNEKGEIVEIKHYGIDGKLSYYSDNSAIQRAKYDSKGRCVEVSYYDINDKPCYTKSNYSIERVKYNSNDCIVEFSCFDINNKPCIEKNSGVHKVCYKYDKHNYIKEESLYDNQNTPTISPIYYFAKRELKYDDYHQLVTVKYYDNKGMPCFSDHYASELHRTYDNRGNLTREDYFDIDGKPCICKNGYATISLKYDNYGNIIEERYYGIEGEPIYISMCTSVQHDYFLNGLLKETRCYDENDKLCINNNWYAICRFEYDYNGNKTKESFFDVDTIPCYIKDGLFSCLKSEYNSNGDVIKETYYDINGDVSLRSGGLYAIVKYKCDNYHRVIECAYYDEKERPCYYHREGHKVCVEYDQRGNVLSNSYFNPQGYPCKAKNGSEVIKYTYDIKDNRTRVDFANEKGKNINLADEGYSFVRYIYDELNRLVEISYYDKDSVLCWKNDRESSFCYCKIKQIYDRCGNITDYLYYDTNGQPTDAGGFARIFISYDERNRMKARKYYNKDGHLTPGQKYRKAIELYEYDDNNRVKNIVLLNSDSTFYVSHTYTYNSRGYTVSSENRDKEGDLTVVFNLTFGRVPYAVLKMEWDDFGNLLSHNYYDSKGNLMNTEDGYSTEKWKYDASGRLISEEFFDDSGQAVCSKTQGWHKSTGKYNNKGLVEEITYYDEKGCYKNVFTPEESGGCKIIYEYNEKGELINSKLYESKEGKLFEVHNRISDNNSIVRKAEGSLVMGLVAMPGLFLDKGYSGDFFIIVFNDWCIYDDLNKIGETLVTSSEKERHILMVPWEEQNGEYKLGGLIEETFPAGVLGVRFVDVPESNDISNDIFNKLVDIYESYKKSKK